MTRDEINSIGAMLASLRHADEKSVTIGFAAHAGCSDTPNGSVSATVEADGHSATSEAVALDDALHLARAKLAREGEGSRRHRPHQDGRGGMSVAAKSTDWHRGWHISKSFFGYWFQHPGFDPDNVSDWRHGYATSVEEARHEIDRLLEEDAEWTAASQLLAARQDPSA
ncbi:hypothetical protein [Sphingomonas sp. 1P08PE]|uniref:hypothetical protein n=1 Tax=Sphingomonas sp. 1P08PE TaxID=554122 RepID=UPI00399FF58C